MAGWFARAIIISCTFVNTRLLINQVGVEGFAAFSIVLSLTPWLSLLNLGLPYTSQNLIAKHRANGLKPIRIRRSAVDAACTALLLYLLPALIIGMVVYKVLLHGYGPLSFFSVAILVWSLIALGLTAIFHQVLYALHRSTWPAVAPAVQAGLTSCLLIVVHQVEFKDGTANNLLATLAIALPILFVFALSAILVGARLRTYIDWRALRWLLYTSRGFLLFGLSGALALSCDYIVMSQMLTGKDIAEYNLASKIFSVILTLHAVLLATSWTPLSDRFFGRDHSGMRQVLLHLLMMGLILVLLLGVPLALGINHISQLLTGGRLENFPIGFAAAWLIYICLRVWSDTFATALLSCDQINVINRYVIWQAIISLLAQLLLGSHFGAIGIVLGISTSFLLTAAWILPLRFYRLTGIAKKKCHGSYINSLNESKY